MQDRFFFRLFVLALSISWLGATKSLASVEDSAIVHPTKRYIRPCFYFNHFSTPKRRSDELKEYRFAQNNIGFYMPLYTATWYNKDNVGISSFHLLGGVDMIRYKPNLDFLNESYQIGRLSAGLRMFYSNGNKSVFYVSVMPFVSKEFQMFGDRQRTRFTGTFLYSRTVSRNFAYRVGVARTYTFGRALFMPIIGVRIGPLDKIHANIQFPRNISLDIPIGTKVTMSVFSRSMGGVYNIKTQDTLLDVAVGTMATLRRFELLNGIQFNFRAGDHFNFYISSGITSRRRVSYAFHEDDSQARASDRTVEGIPRSLFLNVGLSIHFGKAKKVYNDAAMYDLFDLNTSQKSGFNETGSVDSDVPADPSRQKLDAIKKLKYKDVEDLVSEDY
jgi:hypothetical protein